MLNTIEAIVKNGQILPLEKFDVPEGTKALVTLLPEDENRLWMAASETALEKIWESDEDDIYAELLEK